MSEVISTHAEARMRQRGVQAELLATLLAWGDVVVPVGRGDMAITASRAAIHELAAMGVRREWCEKLGRLTAVVTANGLVKTCAIIRQSSHGNRRYRHGI